MKELKDSYCILAVSDEYDMDKYVDMVRFIDEYNFYHSPIGILKDKFSDINEGNVVVSNNNETVMYNEEMEKEEFSRFLRKYWLPAVMELNEKVLSAIYPKEGPKGIILYYDSSDNKAKALEQAFKEAAINLRSADYVFAIADIKNSLSKLFANFYDVANNELPVVELIEDASDQMAYRPTEEITENGSKHFIENYEQGRLLNKDKGPVYKITGSNFKSRVMDNNKDVVVYFYKATFEDKDKAVLEELAKELSHNENLLFGRPPITKVIELKGDTSMNIVEGDEGNLYPIIRLYLSKDKSKVFNFTAPFTKQGIVEFIETNIPSAKSKSKDDL